MGIGWMDWDGTGMDEWDWNGTDMGLGMDKWVWDGRFIGFVRELACYSSQTNCNPTAIWRCIFKACLLCYTFFYSPVNLIWLVRRHNPDRTTKESF